MEKRLLCCHGLYFGSRCANKKVLGASSRVPAHQLVHSAKFFKLMGFFRGLKCTFIASKDDNTCFFSLQKQIYRNNIDV